MRQKKSSMPLSPFFPASHQMFLFQQSPNPGWTCRSLSHTAYRVTKTLRRGIPLVLTGHRNQPSEEERKFTALQPWVEGYGDAGLRQYGPNWKAAPVAAIVSGVLHWETVPWVGFQPYLSLVGAPAIVLAVSPQSWRPTCIDTLGFVVPQH